MIVFPAIDLKDGKCVRLRKGEKDDITIFNHNPVMQAEHFKKIGFKWLHVVDLDGAFFAKSNHAEIIQGIIKTGMQIQLGGGIRSIDSIKMWLNLGVQRIVIGTMALKDPELAQKACKKYPNQIAIGIDTRDNYVATHGWTQDSDAEPIDIIQKFHNAAAIIYTDISRDGMMQGPNIEGIKHILNNSPIPVIASGGVTSNDDVKQLQALDNLYGAIIGRSIYEDKIDISLCI